MWQALDGVEENFSSKSFLSNGFAAMIRIRRSFIFLPRQELLRTVSSRSKLERQKINAFEMVEELGLAVEIRKCIRGDMLAGEMETVTADDIERAIRCVMEQDSDVRNRVNDMAEKCHVALTDGGSSQVALQMFIHDVIQNLP